METLNAGEPFVFDVDGVSVSLSKDDLLIETVQKEGLYAESAQDVTVVLDTNLTEELIEEGFVRELISKIQTMRKEADFDVQNHIRLFAEGSDKIVGILNKNAQTIMNETLTDSMEKNSGYTKEWNINGEKITLSIEKAE